MATASRRSRQGRAEPQRVLRSEVFSGGPRDRRVSGDRRCGAVRLQWERKRKMVGLAFCTFKPPNVFNHFPKKKTKKKKLFLNQRDQKTPPFKIRIRQNP